MTINNHIPQFSQPALCAESDPEMWFYEEKAGCGLVITPEVEMAKRVCKSCPALTECLEYSLRYSGLYGIWGGLDHKERRDYQREHGIETINYTDTMPSTMYRSDITYAV